MTLITVAVSIAVLAADPLTTRIQNASSAAQAMQGPLDGPWILRDRVGHVLYAFQISEPPGSTGRAEGAARAADGGLSSVTIVRIGPRRIRILLNGAGSPTFDVTRSAAGVWRGWLSRVGEVTLSRGLATP